MSYKLGMTKAHKCAVVRRYERDLGPEVKALVSSPISSWEIDYIVPQHEFKGITKAPLTRFNAADIIQNEFT